MASIKCNCFGALGSISGPLSHCPMPPADSAYYQNYPFYNGPCPPGENMPCCKPCRPCGWHYPCPPYPPFPPYDDAPPSVTNRCAALLTCESDFSLSDGDDIPLNAQVLNPEFFAMTPNGLLIRKSGLYMAIFAANLPPQQTVNSVVALTLNGEMIEPSALQIICAGNTSNVCAAGQALVQASPNCTLALNARSGFSISAASDAENVFSLSVVRIQQ